MVSGCCALSLACGSGNGKGKDPASGEAGDRAVLFVTTELKGQIEPCGCNSDPMGDLARTAALVEDARRTGAPVVVLDGGSLLFSQQKPGDRTAEQERLKADLLVDLFGRRLKAAAIGLGPFDLSMGAAAVKPARQAVNLTAGSGVATEPPKIVQAGKVKVGVFGVVSPQALASSKLAAGDPVAAAKSAVADLRVRGADVVVALAHMTRKDARDLARATAGIDFVVVGQNAPADARAGGGRAGGSRHGVAGAAGRSRTDRLAHRYRAARRRGIGAALRRRGGRGARAGPGGGRGEARDRAARRAGAVEEGPERGPRVRRREGEGAGRARGRARSPEGGAAADPGQGQLVHAQPGAHPQGAWPATARCWPERPSSTA